MLPIITLRFVIKNKNKLSEKKKIIADWEQSNPALSAKLKSLLAGSAPNVDYSKIVHKENIATRAASANALRFFCAKHR